MTRALFIQMFCIAFGLMVFLSEPSTWAMGGLSVALLWSLIFNMDVRARIAGQSS